MMKRMNDQRDYYAACCWPLKTSYRVPLYCHMSIRAYLPTDINQHCGHPKSERIGLWDCGPRIGRGKTDKLPLDNGPCIEPTARSHARTRESATNVDDLGPKCRLWHSDRARTTPNVLAARAARHRRCDRREHRDEITSGSRYTNSWMHRVGI